ncbi:hypothetical protein HPP92_009302 [Vanilla planifolia]|uniref:Uncharacterized protein n=1 Tax=Vanilla planifolia TaxID=51239 RepID=A0A835V6I1_VANPL|nr:hypothetical protein HPP92_009302 [Vanilla planifolia]
MDMVIYKMNRFLYYVRLYVLGTWNLWYRISFSVLLWELEFCLLLNILAHLETQKGESTVCFGAYNGLNLQFASVILLVNVDIITCFLVAILIDFMSSRLAKSCQMKVFLDLYKSEKMLIERVAHSCQLSRCPLLMHMKIQSTMGHPSLDNL